jgi:hypothetical protein
MKKRIFAIVLLLFVFVFNAASQKTATVKSFVQTSDHISGADRRKDLNGTPCALVKVQVVDDISRVEGNRIGDIVAKGVEKWVYMCKGSRNMRIHLKNHLPVKIMFQDYQINGLESNRVYELVIETPDASNQLEKQQKLVVNYSPENAMVLIDSKPYKGSGRIETKLPVGEHRYIIAADGYITAEGVVILNEQGAREITERLMTENTTIVESKTSAPVKTTTNNKKYKKIDKEDRAPLKAHKPQLYQVTGFKPGLKGYVEVGYALGLSDDDDGCGLVRAALGYQFTPHIFTGLGAGVGLYDEFEELGIPVFANFRYYILNKRLCPFVDAKVGYSFGDVEGLYMSPSLGCRLAIGKRMAITTSVCLEVQDYKDSDYRYYYDSYYGGYYESYSKSKTALSLGLKVGLEF